MTDEQRNSAALAQGSTFVWHEVYGASSQASIDFYTKALGFESMEMPMGERNYKMLVANGQPVAGVIGTSEFPGMDDVPPHWATYLAVSDVDEKLAACQEHGAKLVHGPMDVPTIGRMALIQDPQGAHIWLFRPEM
jgi:uncharacterized protein